MTLWIGPMLPNANIALTGQNQTQQFSKVNGEKIQPVQSNQPSAVQDVYRYIQQNNGKIPNTKITANISWKEMLGNNNTDAERKQECSLSVLTNVYNTAATLQKVLNQYFPGKSIKINSGWRSVRNNRSCNGKPTSKHLSGLAIDFNIQGVKSHALGQFLNTVWVGWVGVYADFVHVQINPSRGRANDR